MALAVIAATCGLMPRMSAISSMHSMVMREVCLCAVFGDAVLGLVVVQAEGVVADVLDA